MDLIHLMMMMMMMMMMMKMITEEIRTIEYEYVNKDKKSRK